MSLMKMNPAVRRGLTLLLAMGLVARTGGAEPADSLAAIPDRLVVLTFDDASKSHFTVAGPILKQYGFGATFFITEGFDFKTNKEDYLTWDQIRQLHEDGFRNRQSHS